MKNIAVIGAGYVGLVTGACFAQKGNHVTIIEINQDKIAKLLRGEVPFYEPGLDTLVANAIANKTITFVTSIAQALTDKPELIFSCVGTPSLPNGAADLSYVEAAAAEIGAAITDYTLVVNKSTVPVGTGQKVQAIIAGQLAQRGITVPFDVASNPEFLKEGDAINDFLNPDRVVVGVESPKAAQLLRELYDPFITSDEQFLCMNRPSAELTKYAANTMLATRISFMNQLAILADLMGADIDQVKRGIANDRRIGNHFLNAGIGYGGSCFPKDVKALIHMGSEYHFPMTLVKEVDNINHFQRVWFINKISTHYGPLLKDKTVGIWGLAFKPETDDIRCAPSLDLIDDLLLRESNVLVYDPVAMPNISARYGGALTYATSAQQILEESDFLVILTEWKEFLEFKPESFNLLRDKTVFDGRNCFNPSAMQQAGIRYLSVGRNHRAVPSTLPRSYDGTSAPTETMARCRVVASEAGEDGQATP